MTHFSHFIEKMAWGVAGLAVMLIVLFAILHVLRSNAIASVPVVGAPVAGASNWVGAHTTSW